MALHPTIDPRKAVRWERAAALRTLAFRVLTGAVVCLGGYVGHLALDTKAAEVIEVNALVAEPPGADGQASVSYIDPAGVKRMTRMPVAGASNGESIRIELSPDALGAPRLPGSFTSRVVGAFPWVVIGMGVIILCTAPSLVVRLERAGRAARLLEQPPQPATFDWYRRESGGRQVSMARIMPRENIWDDHTVQLGRHKIALDPSITHEVQVWGETRGNEPMVVVGEAWTFVLVR